MRYDSKTTNPIKVGFNASLLCDPKIRGWNRYAINLLEQLPAAGVQLTLYTMKPLSELYLSRLPIGSFVEVRSGEMNYTKWEQWWLPRRIRQDGIDVFHSPYHFGVPLSASCPCVVTLHDAIGQHRWPRFGGWRNALQARNWVNYGSHVIARRKAKKVITVSRYSQTELVRRLGINAAKVTVIPEAADPVFAQHPTEGEVAETTRRYQLSRPYFFYIGGFEARKNLELLVKSFASAGLQDIDLALAGGDDVNRERLRSLASELGVLGNVRFLGRVDDQELPALYRQALAFVYPSLEEGFGLQLCEAMAVGCPLLSSHLTSLPEVLEDGGITFDPTNGDELASLLEQVAEDSTLRETLSERSRQRGKHFSWQETARLTRNVYESVADRSGTVS